MARKTRIVIHASATPPSMDIRAKDIDRWHKAKGWAANGYAVVIPRTGPPEGGRDLDRDGDTWEEVGAHAAGFNEESIGVCLVGGINEVGEPEFNFTQQQMKYLDFIVSEIRQQHPIEEVCGHNELPGVTKACPCFSVKNWYGGEHE